MKVKVTATTRLEIDEVNQLKERVERETGRHTSLSAAIALAVRSYLLRGIGESEINAAVKEAIEKKKGEGK